MPTFVSINRSGKYVIRPKIELRPRCAGITTDGAPLFVVDVPEDLSAPTCNACEELWGKDWKKELVKVVSEEPHSLRLLDNKEKIEVTTVAMASVDSTLAQIAAAFQAPQERKDKTIRIAKIV